MLLSELRMIHAAKPRPPPAYLRPPVRFSRLITPSPITEQWAATVDGERVPGAVLLTGPEGAELLPLALSLVTYLQCADRQETDGGRDACGVCAACRQNASLAHPDVLYTFPVVNLKSSGAASTVTAGDHLPKWREAVLGNPHLSQTEWLAALTDDNKAGNISTAEVSRILHHLSLARFTEGYKVVLIWGADYLGAESNRLLKAIEEPPERTLILLLTTRFERILPTIFSRCRILRLPVAPMPVLAKALQRDYGLVEATAQQVAYASGGQISQAVATARHLADGGGAGPDLAGWLRACFAGKGAAIVKAATELTTLTREQQKHFLHRALRFVRELGVARAGTPRPLMLSPTEGAVATKLASLTDWPQLTALAEELERLLVAVERNANGKIAFTATSIRIHHILARQDPSTQLRRAS